MCFVTATELKQNLSHYLDLAQKENVYVTRNGKTIITMSPSHDKALADFLALKGILKNQEVENKSDKELIAESIIDKCGI